ncbi:unnamed protein product [Cuscuta campestris]|uniref:Integrase zinc-binding domain-containing protein n=1 Tax=Cuscuta campestris TaxID=132261 RepID=A0A484LVB7_9ASTE|nr:unnamed protein product [Cuscuta campestris]
MFHSLSVQAVPLLMDELRKENDTLPDLRDLHAAIGNGTAPPDISSNSGILYYKRRLYISPSSSLRNQILHEFHGTLVSGHQGVDRTFRRIADVFYWPGLRREVRAFVASCPACQATKYSTRKPAGLLQPLPIPERVWDSASMDFVTGLPPSRGFSAIMVVVDRLSKYTHFGPLVAGFDAPKAAQLFVDIVGRPVSVPTAVLDRRSVLVDGVAQEQWLVRWSDGTDTDATWEPASALQQHYPDLRLEDKAISVGRGVDTVHEEDMEPGGDPSPGTVPLALTNCATSTVAFLEYFWCSIRKIDGSCLS